LYSLNLCCLLFFLSFSFSLARACIWAVPPLAHRVWVIEGARKRGIDVVAGRETDERLNLAREARHELVVAMVGRCDVDSSSRGRAPEGPREARRPIGNFKISGARGSFCCLEIKAGILCIRIDIFNVIGDKYCHLTHSRLRPRSSCPHTFVPTSNPATEFGDRWCKPSGPLTHERRVDKYQYFTESPPRLLLPGNRHRGNHEGRRARSHLHLPRG
jgi:hypothetical protein